MNELSMQHVRQSWRADVAVPLCRRVSGRSKHTFLAATALATLTAAPAFAQEVPLIEIDDERTSTVRTSGVDGGNAADITVLGEGSIVVESGPALVLDSDNSVLNEGVLESDADANGSGILVETAGGRSADIGNSGTIRVGPELDLNEDERPTTGPNFGIRLDGEGVFEGDILNSGTGLIEVTGDGAVGIDIGGPMIGDIVNQGSIDVRGDDAVGIRLSDTLDGDLTNSGSIQSTLEGGGVGILVGGDISGQLVNQGTVAAGAPRRADQRRDLVEQQAGVAALFVNADVAGGIVNGPTEDGGAGSGADLLARGGGSGLLVSARSLEGVGRDVTLGVVGVGDEAFAVINRASIRTDSQIRDAEAPAVRIEGAEIGGEIFQTVLEGGFLNAQGATIGSSTADGQATGVSIGAHATVPVLRNDGQITAQSRIFTADTDLDGANDETGVGADAVGIQIDADASVPRIENNGTIQVQAAGEDASAYGIRDLSGSVSEFINTGSISLAIQNDSSGSLTAIDFSANTTGIDFFNSGTIVGNVLLGAGNDVAVFDGGVFGGRFDLAGGSNSLTLRNGAQFSGTLLGDNIDLFVSDAQFNTTSETATRVRSALFENSSILRLAIVDQNLGEGGLFADDSIVLGSDTQLDPDFFAFPMLGEPVVLLSAQTLDIGGSLEELNLQAGVSSVLFETDLALIQADGREELVLNLRRRTAEEIGLDAQQGAVLDAASEALPNDNELGAAIANIGDVDTLTAALDQLTPEFSEISRFVAVNAQTLALNTLSARFQSRRDLTDASEAIPEVATQMAAEEFGLKRSKWSFYLEELVTIADRDTTEDVKGYDGDIIGLMAGVDRPMFGLDAVGLSVMQSIADFDDDLFDEDDFEILSTQVNLYATYGHKGFFVDVLGSFAFHDLERTRTVSFGNFQRAVSADWNATQFGGSAQAGYRLQLGRYGFSLTGNINYTKLDEDGYTEDAGEGGIGFVVEDRDITSLRAGANIKLDALFDFSDELKFRPSIYGGILSELDDTELTTRARFDTGSQLLEFTSPVAQDDSIIGGLGLSFLTRRVIVSFNYNVEIADDFFGHNAGLSVRMRF